MSADRPTRSGPPTAGGPARGKNRCPLHPGAPLKWNALGRKVCSEWACTGHGPEPEKKGRPFELAGSGPRITARLDLPSNLALESYRTEYDLDASDVIREILTAWRESARVQSAIQAWRNAR